MIQRWLDVGPLYKLLVQLVNMNNDDQREIREDRMKSCWTAALTTAAATATAATMASIIISTPVDTHTLQSSSMRPSVLNHVGLWSDFVMVLASKRW